MAVKQCLSCRQRGGNIINIRVNRNAVANLEILLRNRNEELPATGVKTIINSSNQFLWISL